MSRPVHTSLWRLLSGSLLGRAAGAICGLLLQIAVARLLGVAESGQLYTAISVTMLFGIIAKYGLDTDLMRRAGADWHAGKPQALAQAYGSAISTVSIAGLLTGAGLILLAPQASLLLFGHTSASTLIQLLALSIPVYAIVCLQAALLKAMDRPGAAALLEIALVPAATLGFSLLATRSTDLSITTVGAAQLAASLLTATIGGFWIRLPAAPFRAGLRRPALAAGGRNLTGIELLNFALASLALPLTSSLAGASEAGLFNAAIRLSTQIGMIGLIVGGLLAPRFAALHQQNAQQALTRLAQQGTLMMCALAALPLAVMLIWPEGALLLFGTEFSGLEWPLRILLIGQLFNMLTGPAGFLLVMCGRERDLRDILLISATISLPLTAALAFTHGAIGAASAMSLGMALQNILAASRVRRHLNIPMLALNWRSLQRKPATLSPLIGELKS